jgi:asparagine synthase (glutamine-hydrolysing)
MTAICGWIPNDRRSDPARVVTAMTCALRVHDGQSCALWTAPGPCAVGLLEPWPAPQLDRAYAPAISQDRRHYLWMAGEVFNSNTGKPSLDVVDAVASRTLAYRQAVLELLLERGVEAVQHLDGEYLIALWNTWDNRMILVTDRFASIPLFLAAGAEGVAFATGVRGALVAPGISADPDLEALHEAVTFGGFRVGDRTNVAGVKRTPGAAIVEVREGRIALRRYRHWPIEPPPSPPPEPAAAVEHAHALWSDAVRRRLVGCDRPGQSLSGGLDSRAILAEGARRTSSWMAITYGLPGCDDACYAQRAAEVAGATWVFHPLYSGSDPDWLERRSAYVQETDGLMQLVDLMHLECLPLQRDLLDVHLSGYIGDAVCGPTFSGVCDPTSVAAKMPFTGSPLGWSWDRAQRWAEEAIGQLGGAAPRFALFEHKLPQSTHPIFQALTPYMRVRRPFLDGALFEFFSSLAPSVRALTYHGMLKSKYPEYFVHIPDQSTGMPILTPRWRVNMARASRVGRRIVQRTVAHLGVRMRPRLRAYIDDHRVWAQPSVRARIESVVLRNGSLCCERFGRALVQKVLTDWFDRAAGPSQVVGALYVFELYHRDLAESLQASRRAMADTASSDTFQVAFVHKP